MLLKDPFRANMGWRNAAATSVNLHENDAELFVVLEGTCSLSSASGPAPHILVLPDDLWRGLYPGRSGRALHQRTLSKFRHE